MKKLYNIRLVSCIAVLLLAAFTTKTFAITKVVAQDGSGDYTTVQAAITAAPDNGSVAYTIFIKNGKYREKITVPATKTFLQLVGESVANVIIYYDDPASKMTSCVATVGTQNSASFTVSANDFTAVNITFANTFGDGSQAVAVLVNADRAAFKNCRFLANQDTLYIKGSGTPRCYFKNCYIDGNVDFIFGSSIALFDSCVVYAKTRPSTSSSFITAPNTPNGQAYGYVFRDALLPMNVGTTLYFLSRPWPSPDVANTRQKTVFLSSRLSSHINPAGWTTWDANTNTSNVYYGEYNSKFFNNTTVDISNRVAWSYQLNATNASTYTWANMFTTWDSTAVATLLNPAASQSIAVSNFRGVKGVSSSQFNWNISWPMNGIDYTLYRSSDNVNFTSVYNVTAANDTAVNFAYTDATIPASGTNYYYYIAAAKASYDTHNTDTVKILSTPNIVVSGADPVYYCGVSQVIGVSSASQSYTISATDLTGNLIITPPVNFEVSLNNTNWFTNAAPLSITPTGGSVANTVIYVRLNATLPGNYSGNVINTSASSNTILVPVTGNAIIAPTINSVVIQQWPLTANNTDDASVRSAYVNASTSTFNKLVVSNGTTVTNYGAYTATYGQATAVTAAGEWGTASPVFGPGGNVNRTFYQQFSVTATTASIRLDSITLNATYLNTESNTRMGIVYSKTAFTTNDSTSVSGVTNPNGVTSDSGSFVKPVFIPRVVAGPVSTYRFAIAGTSGVTINAGETLTFRIYNSCGSSSNGRYLLMKNLTVKGEAVGTLPLDLVEFKGAINNNIVKLEWKTTNEVSMNNYIVEKSSDAVNYTSLGNVVAKNAAVNNYIFNDVNPFQGINYYRLKMMNKDGSFKYSRIITINTKLRSGIGVYPNPAINNVVLSHDLAGVNAAVSIVTAQGKQIASYKIIKGNTQTTIDVATLNAGVYFIKYIDGANTATAKFIKQ